jgi:acetolactate synthase regulatory subunit
VRFDLEITTANSEGALERILGCLRQRGFALCGMNADRSLDHSAMEVRLTLEGTRPMELAVKQVSKLYDVMNVQVQQMEVHESNGYRQLHAATQN